MANSYYTPSGQPTSASRGRSINVREEFALVEDGFDAVETAMNLKAPKASPTFTGTLTAVIAAFSGALSAASAAISGALTAATATFSGLLTVNGGQIKFPATQVPSADANTLDDYEEGSWTPNLTGSDSGGSPSFSTRIGRYTKVGRIVHYSLELDFTGGAGNGYLIVNNLPFSTSGNGAFASAIVSEDPLWSSSAERQAYVSASSGLIITTVEAATATSVKVAGSYIAG